MSNLVPTPTFQHNQTSYVTFDLDICYARDDENLTRLARVFNPVKPRLRGAPVGLPFRFDERTLKRGLNFTLTTEIGDIDLIGEVTGAAITRWSLAAASISVQIFGRTYVVLMLNALIASKRVAGRPKDLQVLPELQALRGATEES